MSAPVTVTWGGRPVPVSTDPNPPRVEGRHAFVATALFAVRDPSAPDPVLDHENFYAVALPFCWWCRATADDGSPCPGFRVAPT